MNFISRFIGVIVKLPFRTVSFIEAQEFLYLKLFYLNFEQSAVIFADTYLQGGTEGQCHPKEKFCMLLPPNESSVILLILE